MNIGVETKLRMTLYTIVMFFLVPAIFCGFNWLCLEGLNLFFKFKENMFWLIFWVLFIAIGITIILFVRYVATFLATCIINLFAQICPVWRYKFSERWITVMCILSIICLFVGYWDYSTHPFDWWVLGILLLLVNLYFARDIIRTLKKFNDIRREDLLSGGHY